MATYPKSRRTMPGTSGGIRAGLDFRTGEAAVWEQIGRLGATVTDVGQKFYLQQAEVQLMDSINQAEGEMLELNNRLRKNTDEDTYHKELSKSIKTMQRFRPKNGMATKGYDSWIKSQTIGWRSDVEKSRQIRIDNKWHAETDILVEKARDNGSTAQVKIHVASGLALGIIDENTAGDILREATHDSQRGIVERIVLGSNPESFLDKYKTFQELEKDYSDLTPGDFQDLRAMAQGQQRNLRNIQDEQQNVIRHEIIDKFQARDPDTVAFINENIIDADERYTWLRRYSDEMKRFAGGDVIVTDQRVKHEILDYAAAINWTDRNVSVQDVLDKANDARYPSDGTNPAIDDAAYDEIRDLIRREMEDKAPFTQSYIEKGIGELMTGAPSSILGIPLPTLRSREDYMKHATNLFGRYVSRIPGVMETINAKFPPPTPEKKKEELLENPAHDFDGEIIGSYNPNGSITLNRLGVRRLYELAGRDIEMTRKMVLENRYVIPEETK